MRACTPYVGFDTPPSPPHGSPRAWPSPSLSEKAGWRESRSRPRRRSCREPAMRRNPKDVRLSRSPAAMPCPDRIAYDAVTAPCATASRPMSSCPVRCCASVCPSLRSRISHSGHPQMDALPSLSRLPHPRRHPAQPTWRPSSSSASPTRATNPRPPGCARRAATGAAPPPMVPGRASTSLHAPPSARSGPKSAVQVVAAVLQKPATGRPRNPRDSPSPRRPGA